MVRGVTTLAMKEHGNDYPAGYVRWTENRNITIVS